MEVNNIPKHLIKYLYGIGHCSEASFLWAEETFFLIQGLTDFAPLVFSGSDICLNEVIM